MNSDFFKDRNGIDKLSIFLGVAGIGFLAGRGLTKLVGLCILAYAAFRALSKDKYKRHNEEMIFEDLLVKIKYNFNNVFKGGSFKNIKQRLEEKKNYKIVKCPKCGQKLRLPRGKGKIVVTCRKCSHEFKMKS